MNSICFSTGQAAELLWQTAQRSICQLQSGSEAQLTVQTAGRPSEQHITMAGAHTLDVADALRGVADLPLLPPCKSSVQWRS